MRTVRTFSILMLTQAVSLIGSGMGLLIVSAGTLMALLTVLVYAHPATRHVEQQIPDQQTPLAS